MKCRNKAMLIEFTDHTMFLSSWNSWLNRMMERSFQLWRQLRGNILWSWSNVLQDVVKCSVYDFFHSQNSQVQQSRGANESGCLSLLPLLMLREKVCFLSLQIWVWLVAKSAISPCARFEGQSKIAATVKVKICCCWWTGYIGQVCNWSTLSWIILQLLQLLGWVCRMSASPADSHIFNIWAISTANFSCDLQLVLVLFDLTFALPNSAFPAYFQLQHQLQRHQPYSLPSQFAQLYNVKFL